MKKTRINSVIFIMISAFLLLSAVVLLVGSGMYLVNFNATQGIALIIAGILTLVGGVIVIDHAHEILFDKFLTQCFDCKEHFEEDKIEKQVEHTIYGHMYVSYRCPRCKSSLELQV